MASKWQKDYPLITDLSEAGLDENNSFKKMASLIEDDKHVVDFGCATGYFAQLLTQKGCTVTGVEINADAAEVARQYCKDVIVADLDFVTLTDILPSQAFNLAVFGDVLEHLRDPWRILEETKDIIKPDGYVVVSIPNVAHGAVRLSLLQGKFEYDKYGLLDNTHLRFFTRETVEELFERTGYFIDASTRTVIPIFSESNLIPRVDRNCFSPEIIQKIEQEEDSDTLQFVCRAFPLTPEGRFTALRDRYSSLLEQYKRVQLDEKIRFTQAQEKLLCLETEVQQVQEKLLQTQTEVQQAQEKLLQTQTEAQYVKTEMRQTIEHYLAEKEAVENQLQKAQLQFKNMQARFQWAESQLKYAQRAVGGLEAQVRSLHGEARQKQNRLEQAQTEVEQLRTDLGEAVGRLEAIQTSKFWKIRTTWFQLKRLLKLVTPDTELFAFNQLAKTQATLAEKELPGATSERLPEMAKMFAFISDCPGDTYRYRCQHQAEMLEYLGYNVDVYEASRLPYNKLLKHYRIVVVHRVPHTYEFESFVFKAREQGILVVFETDDLVFEPAWIHHVDAYMSMDETNQRLYEDGVKRYQQALGLCEYAIVSTDKLKREIQNNFPQIKTAVSRNRVSHAMELEATRAQKVCLPKDGILRIAYFSGTKTHAKDFAECVPALQKILREYSHVNLMIVGHLDIPEELQDLVAQIEYIPLVPWKNLPLLYRRVDINLAPLEHQNDFTEAKSELKYFEAGLLAVPTIASNLEAFRVAIQDGVNGRLCSTPEDWLQALHELIIDAELRQQMGQAAFKDVQNRYLTRSAASEAGEIWRNLISGNLSPSQTLSVAFVLRAPIAQTGGGYKHIFNIAHYLAEKGHNVHIYVDPIAHLTGFSVETIRAFCEENFGRSRAIIHRGHDNILSTDVAIATNWPTAYVVSKLTNTRFRSYYVQDYETFFYQASDDNFAQAEATYDLPLGIITLGRYLSQLLSERNHRKYPYIDFSLNEVFLAQDSVLSRHDDPEDSCSILFFARPNIPRRNFGLGVKVLEKFHQLAPNVKIQLYGMEDERELPFPYENLGVLSQAETAAAMRSATIHLSFSMTNITTVIFEAMACGCATVEVDVSPVRGMVQDGENCLLAKPNAQAVCDTLLKLVNDHELRKSIATSGFNSVKHLTIENMCSQFEIFLRQYSFQTN
jgi:glycosyltransferase involved in cell wall biosynthesis/2-polyprenyl-3-methyl-5-hydroxy-6-metoxy-1,4-benzoquinol methylase